MAEVRLEAVDKTFGDNTVVSALDLDVRAGEFLALLGPSGCGKTTTLRMIAGLERATRGTISIGQEVVDGAVRGQRRFVAPERRGLGMVFQSYAIWPHRSVRRNVAYPLELAGVRGAELDSRVRAALAAVRLEAFADRSPHQLSGGQLQRVAVARAIVANPRVLLLDEPLSNLDAALREELRAELAALRKRLDATLIYVTHDQVEALALADRIAVIKDGRIEQLDAPQRLYDEPASPFVGAFVGGANVLRGVVVDGEFVVDGAAISLPKNLMREDGPATLVLRPEDVELVDNAAGPAVLQARLFLGHGHEYRLALGEQTLKVVSRSELPSERATVVARRAKIFQGRVDTDGI